MRRFIVRHPILWLSAWLVAPWVWFIGFGLAASRFGIFPHLVMFIVGIYLPVLLFGLLPAGIAGHFRVRAGLRLGWWWTLPLVTWPLHLICWVGIYLFVGLVIMGRAPAELVRSLFTTDEFWGAWFMHIAWASWAVGIAMGLLAAWLVNRRMVRTGRWQQIVPVERPRDARGGAPATGSMSSHSDPHR